jgi:hypothetical protein
VFWGNSCATYLPFDFIAIYQQNHAEGTDARHKLVCCNSEL